MNAKTFLQKIDEERILSAITAAELRTSGEVRVFISRRKLHSGEDVISRATARFEKLGMTATRERNATLIYLMPLEQKYAVIGDTGIHQKCGPAFWQEVSAAMAPHLAAGAFTDAILHAIHQIGDTLAHHFPRQSDDSNELGNEILGD